MQSLMIHVANDLKKLPDPSSCLQSNRVKFMEENDGKVDN